MKVEKKDLERSQIELQIELSKEEFKPYIEKGAKKISQEVKIDGFRPGHIPIDVLKQKVSEMTILEESARLAINATMGKVIEKNSERQGVGQPKVDIIKLAPDNPLVYKVTLALLPKIELAEYKGLKVKSRKIEIKDDEIEKALKEIQEMRVKEAAVDRPIDDRDKALVDINMFLDNVPLEGGQNKDTAVIIGQNYIVPGFGKQLIGVKKGETKEFSLPYPKDHHMKNLAGKVVDFKVKIKDVFERQLPEINDEMAAGFGVKSLDELKKNVKKSITDHKQKENNQATEKEALEKLIEKTKFGDLSQMLIEHESKTMMAELEQTVTSQGGKFEDYLTSLKKTKEQLMLDLLPDAIKRVKTSLLIREISIKEKINIEKEEVDKQITDMKAHYAKMPPEQTKEILKQLDTPEYKNYLANIMMSRKVVDKLKEWNVVE